MRLRIFLLSLTPLAMASLSLAADVVAPNAHLKAEGIPPIPAELAAKMAPYDEFKPATPVAWHPEKRELVIARRADNTLQLHLVAAPGNEPKQLTSYTDPVRFGAYLAEQARCFRSSRAIRAATNSGRSIAWIRARGACAPHRPAPRERPRDSTHAARSAAALPLPTSTPLAPARTQPPTSRSSIRSTPAKTRQDRHAARHRLGRLLVLVRRPARRDDRIQVGDRELRLGDGRRDRRAAQRVLPAPRARRRHARSRRRMSISRATARACSSRPTATASSARSRISTSKAVSSNRSGRRNWDVEELALSPDGRTLAVSHQRRRHRACCASTTRARGESCRVRRSRSGR